MTPGTARCGRQRRIACSPTTWIQWLRSGDDSVRKQAILHLAAGTWELGEWTWRDTTLVELIVAPDLSGYTWQDEYAQGRRVGLIDDALDAQVRDAGERDVALVEAGQGPFAQDWSGWRPDPEWPLPALPVDALDAPC